MEKITVNIKTEIPPVDIGLDYAKKYNVKLEHNHSEDAKNVDLLTDEDLKVGLSFVKQFSSFFNK